MTLPTPCQLWDADGGLHAERKFCCSTSCLHLMALGFFSDGVFGLPLRIEIHACRTKAAVAPSGLKELYLSSGFAAFQLPAISAIMLSIYRL